MNVYQVVMMAMVQSDKDPAEWEEGALVDEMLISPSLSVATVQIAEQLSAAEMMARASITDHGVIDADVIEEAAPEAQRLGEAWRDEARRVMVRRDSDECRDPLLVKDALGFLLAVIEDDEAQEAALYAATRMARSALRGEGHATASYRKAYLTAPEAPEAEEAPEAASARDAAWTRPGPSKEIDDSIWNGCAGTLE